MKKKYKIIKGKTQGLEDAEDFIDQLNRLDQQPVEQARTLFNSDKEVAVSRAPGRLDVMGGIADYSGALVLQLPIKEATLAAAQKSGNNTIKIISLTNNESDGTRYFEMRLEDFFISNRPLDYKKAQQYFAENAPAMWASYVAGAFLVLIKEKNIDFYEGANILIYSNVPEGKGVSSSAALEVAAMTALCSAFGISMDPHEKALLCQKIENFVVGAPCGIMDQMASVFGKKNQLMSLVCQPAVLKPFVRIPDGITFWGIDSGIRHSVSGSDYTSVRVGAFMGQRIIAEYFKKEHYPQIPWNYLANITPDIFEEYLAGHLPQKMTGSEFIKKYQNTFDTVTSIDPEKEYNIRNPAAHPVYENHRVNLFAELLKAPVSDEICCRIGELMYLSHESYTSCGLNSSGTDRLVELVKQKGPGYSLYGAKITGGGSGGTVALLGRNEARHRVEEIIDKYKDETGYTPYLFTGSSMGADEFGSLLLKSS